MAGPLLLTLILGVFLVLNKKLSFGFIYGYGVFGGFFIYFLLNMMLENHISLYNVISILGYCLLPVVVVAALNLIFSMKNSIGILFGGFCAILSTSLVLKFLSQTCDFSHKRFLYAYPLFLYYMTFIILIIS